VNAARMAMTPNGAWRRKTSYRHAAACSASMTQASVPGWTGHQDAPASVLPVSSSAKKTAIDTSTVLWCRRDQRDSADETAISRSTAGRGRRRHCSALTPHTVCHC
jgi:hypothetical protein